MDNVTGGNKRRVQVRKVRKGGFTDGKRQVFLDHLAGCCNVTRAAAAAGITTVTINYHRRRDPVFAEQVLQALDAGYGALEASLIERAALGGNYEPGTDTEPGPETVDTDLGVRLLQIRQKLPGSRTGNAGRAPQRATVEELNASILAKLDVLARRRATARAQRKASRGKRSTGGGRSFDKLRTSSVGEGQG
ncbi:MAG TPA: hypothetical protein VGC46_15015 [Allosphingosinicella sp.]